MGCSEACLPESFASPSSCLLGQRIAPALLIAGARYLMLMFALPLVVDAVHTALGSLEVEDLLVGARCPKNRFLASSIAGKCRFDILWPEGGSTVPHASISSYEMFCLETA